MPWTGENASHGLDVVLRGPGSFYGWIWWSLKSVWQTKCKLSKTGMGRSAGTWRGTLVEEMILLSGNYTS